MRGVWDAGGAGGSKEGWMLVLEVIGGGMREERWN